jgi:hypothetical protein
MASVRMYRAQRDKDGHMAAPALIFEARDDAAAIFWARACSSDENDRRGAAATASPWWWTVMGSSGLGKRGANQALE